MERDKRQVQIAREKEQQKRTLKEFRIEKISEILEKNKFQGYRREESRALRILTLFSFADDDDDDDDAPVASCAKKNKREQESDLLLIKKKLFF